MSEHVVTKWRQFALVCVVSCLTFLSLLLFAVAAAPHHETLNDRMKELQKLKQDLTEMDAEFQQISSTK